jgi:hypothetical protein
VITDETCLRCLTDGVGLFWCGYQYVCPRCRDLSDIEAYRHREKLRSRAQSRDPE